MSLHVIDLGNGRYAVQGAGHYQEHDPEQSGFVPMSRSRAEAVAAAMSLQIAEAGQQAAAEAAAGIAQA